MAKLIIIADDLTGALDSGVQFSRYGVNVLIFTEDSLFEDERDAEVLVINSETRHVDSETAYNTIYSLVCREKERGAQFFYKKTDSALRGNVGVELKALLDASGKDRIHFIPAYPKLLRTTVDGIHYIDGVPLAESLFANDIVNPVKESNIEKLIKSQADVETSIAEPTDSGKGIVIHNCSSNQDMNEIYKDIDAKGELYFIAGCAGFLEVLAENMCKIHICEEKTVLHPKLLILSGSLNQVTKKQIDVATDNGAKCYHISVSRILNDNTNNEVERELKNCIDLCSENKDVVIIDTLGDLKADEFNSNKTGVQKITGCLAYIFKKLADEVEDRNLMIIGGDTLNGFTKEMNIKVLKPIKELEPGVVLAKYTSSGHDNYLITKSGGFGNADLFLKMIQQIKGGKYVFNNVQFKDA